MVRLTVHIDPKTHVSICHAVVPEWIGSTKLRGFSHDPSRDERRAIKNRAALLQEGNVGVTAGHVTHNIISWLDTCYLKLAPWNGSTEGGIDQQKFKIIDPILVHIHTSDAVVPLHVDVWSEIFVIDLSIDDGNPRYRCGCCGISKKFGKRFRIFHGFDLIISKYKCANVFWALSYLERVLFRVVPAPDRSGFVTAVQTHLV